MIRPCPCLSITGMISRMNRKGARRLTARSRLKTASSRSKLPGMLMPAPLKSRSTRPCRATMAAAARRTASASAKSTASMSGRCAPARKRCAASSARAASRFSRLRATSTSRYPQPASSRATALPIPRLPPVTTATGVSFISASTLLHAEIFSPRSRPSSELILFRTARARHRQRLF